MASEDRAFKNLIDAEVVASLGGRLDAVVSDFDREAFTRAASAGLSDLELKARVAHVAAALREHLDPDVPTAISQLLASMGPPLQGSEEVTSGMEYWPVLHFVEVWGPEHPEVTLPALKEMTRRFSAEFALRPLLVRDLHGTLEVLRSWLDDPDLHVRRWISEGTRPRLPWGAHLKALQKDPTPTLPLLRALHRDPEEYVRRSVANHLNDISKDHPDLAVEVAGEWWGEGDRQTRRLVRHALRGLIKAGDPGALTIMGYGPPDGVEVDLTLDPVAPGIGSKLAIHLELHNRGSGDLPLLVDYAVHFLRKSPGLSRKVFKWTEKRLAPGQTVVLRKSHTLAHTSTRRLFPGEHRVEVLVNGETLATEAFELMS